MKFFFFHLMPYADLDQSYSEIYNSAWVTLPNSYYDPVKGHRLYNRYLDELEYADTLGFDGIGVNEHHQNAYGLMPIPGVMAGILARNTKRARIAVLGRALPLLNNPLVVAEYELGLDWLHAAMTYRLSPLGDSYSYLLRDAAWWKTMLAHLFVGSGLLVFSFDRRRAKKAPGEFTGG